MPGILWQQFNHTQKTVCLLCVCLVRGVSLSFTVLLLVVIFTTFPRCLLQLVLLGNSGFFLSRPSLTLILSWVIPSKWLTLDYVHRSLWSLNVGLLKAKQDCFFFLFYWPKVWFVHRARRKKKVKKPGVPALSSQATFSDADVSGLTSSSRRRRRPLPMRPTGSTNGAFEPDT